ncbi:acyl-CoA dehydrogenase family protein [Salsuginibacillus kocurii]|uniref:acyl-CoA dehydrogenase family protein n=1 Tax=Salsuginibacillus kocurii TaxID=427078 RepID=UPI00037A5BEC|nr:acyl-CoA dehydrogenase family protein [Salsuginibacillus kocurii]
MNYEQDPNLHYLLEKYMEKDLFDYAQAELPRFASYCHEVDVRAAHTDRGGQPQLIKYDKFGNDISHVWVNEGYRQTVNDMYNTGIVGYVHKDIPELGKPGTYHYSYAQGYLLSQAEPGFYCPVTLTMAVAYLVDTYADDELKTRFLPHILSTGDVELYEGATFLTERQGGSDVGANEVQAVKEGDHYRLYGEKYFASNAGMCGVSAVLARKEDAPAGTKGLSLFLMPWDDEEGNRNNLSVRRLKDKLGVRAVPSAEVELEGAKAYLVGEAERGFYYMMEALNLSRVCNAVASVGIMRRAYDEALAYTHEREAFGQKLSDYPMVRETLMHLLSRQEVETSAVFKTVDLFDRVMMRRVPVTQEDEALNRLYIALIKARTAEEAIDFAHEAIELHGGNGYIEDFVTPRLLRDAQVLTVWEGTENILGLEVLRLITKFNADQLFIREMKQSLSQLGEKQQKQAKPVEKALVQLEQLTENVKTAPPSLQTYHAKKVADLMTDIFLSITALEDAAAEPTRKPMIAELFLEQIWREENTFDPEPRALTYFEELVRVQEKESVL